MYDFNTQASFNFKDQTLLSLLSSLCIFQVTALKIVKNVGSFHVCFLCILQYNAFLHLLF